MPETITSMQRVEATLNFKPLDYIPLYDQYWGGFVAAWRIRHGLPSRTDVPPDDIVRDDADIETYFHLDMTKAIPNEDPWPSLKQFLRWEGEYIIEQDGWGRVVRRKATSPYGQLLEAGLVRTSDLERLEFESPDMDLRYQSMLEWIKRTLRTERRPYVFIKVGGPYLRSSFLRGELQWYMDIGEDPSFASALAARVTDHLIAVGVKALHRSALPERSIWIFDDIASDRGLLMSPKSYERLFLPQVRRMIEAFKAAGATQVGFHSDGDVRSVLDGLVEAGINILNPVEPRANMDVVDLRRRYGQRLAFVGGVCNSRILPTGDDQEVRHHLDRVLSIAGESGLVIGSHSIGPDITQERYELFIDIFHFYLMVAYNSFYSFPSHKGLKNVHRLQY